MDHPRHAFVHGRHRRRGRRRRRSSSASDIVVHFAAETHVDRSIMNAGEFITTDVDGTFVLLEAARRGAGACGGSCRSRPTRSTAACRTGASTETDELRPRNPYSASKAGADRLAYSYWATYDVPVVITRASNNYGPYQFPGEGHPALRHQRDRRHPGAALRRRPERARLAARRRSLPRDRPADRRGRRGEVYNIGGGNDVTNVDLTHRILRAARQARVAHQAGRRSARARSPLLARHDEAAGARLGAAGAVRAGPARDRRVVSRRTSGGGGRSRTGDPAFRPTTTRSTAIAAPDALPCLVLPRHRRHRFAGSHLLEHLLDAASRAVAAWAQSAAARSAAPRRSDASRWTAVDLLDRDAVRARARGRCGPRSSITAPASRTSASRGPTRSRRCGSTSLGTHHLLDAVRRAGLDVPRARDRLGARLPAVDRADRRRRRRSARRVRTASASSRRRCSRRARPRVPVFVARPFNHAGPRQSPAYVTSSFARQIAEIEAGLRDAGPARRQPRRAPRHHRRARHRARLPAAGRARPAGAALQRLQRARVPHAAICSRSCSALAHARRSASRSIRRACGRATIP